MSTSSRMQDKLVVVTGGNSGIGLETARQVVAEGGSVAIFGRNRESLDAALAELGERAFAVQGDATHRPDLDRLFAEVTRHFGRPVDALFVNAGIAKPSPFDETDEAFFDQLFDVNVKGAYFTVQAALPHLATKASVIFTTSALDEKGMPGMSVYSSTKAALRSLARSLAAELHPRGVRVNSIAPGPVETPIYERMGLPAEQLEGMAGQILSATPAGRFGRPEEIARAALFLASDDSTYVLGAELAVDGGFAQL